MSCNCWIFYSKWSAWPIVIQIFSWMIFYAPVLPYCRMSQNNRKVGHTVDILTPDILACRYKTIHGSCYWVTSKGSCFVAIDIKAKYRMVWTAYPVKWLPVREKACHLHFFWKVHFHDDCRLISFFPNQQELHVKQKA